MQTKTKTLSSKRVRKLDGVVEAAHFNPDGSLAWVRAYERRGPTWSDTVLLDRATLMARLREGKRFYVGVRKPLLASEFDLSVPLRRVEFYRGEALVTGPGKSREDHLEYIPVV